MFRRLRDSKIADATDDIRGATVYGAGNEKIGKIDDVLFDPDTHQARYAIIDTGGWLTSRKFLIPSDYVHTVSGDPDAFTTNLTKRDVEGLPPFDEGVLESDDRFADYENRYRTKWTSYGFTLPAARHPRIERIESRLLRNRIEPARTAREAETAERNVTRERVTTPAMTGSTVASSGAPISVFGVYADRAQLERAVERLRNEGFDSSDISVVFPDKGRTERFAYEHNTKAPEGAAAGGGTGLVVGGVLGWLAGIGTLAIPGIGPLLAAGPIVAALAGAGAVGAIGGIAGALVGAGMPELEAKRYEKEIREGRMMISVRCTDPRLVYSARAALVETDAKDVFQTGEKLAA